MLDVSKRYYCFQKLIRDYWSRFCKTYSSELRQQHVYSNRSSRENIVASTGDIVLIKDDTHILQGQSRLGKIDEFITCRDGSAQ